MIAEGLVAFGVLSGEPEGLVESGAVHVFFPHGIGHMVGLGIRDAGEVLPGRDDPPDAFPRLRVDLPLLPGYTMTIEPGVYVVPALVSERDRRERHRNAIDWGRAERMLASVASGSKTTCSSPRTATRCSPRTCRSSTDRHSSAYSRGTTTLHVAQAVEPANAFAAAT